MTTRPHRPRIERTERGRMIAGTRITLDDVRDDLDTPSWTREHLLEMPPAIDAAQLQAALDDMAAHRDAFEREYQQVFREVEAFRRAWEERNKDVLAHIEAAKQSPEGRARWAELERRRQEVLRERSRRAGAARPDADPR